MTDQVTALDAKGGSRGDGGTVSRRRLLSVAGTTIASGTVSGLHGAGPIGTVAGVRRQESTEIHESLWVETNVDTDDDGVADRLFVRVVRPASTAEGDRVPVIMEASPYHGAHDHHDNTGETRFDRSVELGTGDVRTATPAENSPGDQRASHRSGTVDAGPIHRPSATMASHQEARHVYRYIPKGYAIVDVSSLGTHFSTGCYTAAGPKTADAIASVVDWLNGRADGYDDAVGGSAVTADWATGRTGMIGTSAGGELAIAAATTGVDGLEAIVPQAADISHYSMFRANGTPIAPEPNQGERMPDISSWIAASNQSRPECDHWAERAEAGQDRATGDYNDFWYDRAYFTDVDSIRAGVLLTHGFEDGIVKPNQFADCYAALRAHGVPVRAWLHAGGHESANGNAWWELLDRWWAHWLKGADNGVMDEDPVTVIHGGATPGGGTLEPYADWPHPAAAATAVGFGADGSSIGRLRVPRSDDGLADDGGTEDDVSGDPGPATFVDDPTTLAADLVAAGASPHRLRYETPPLESPVHVSGRVVPSLSVSMDDATVISAALVEYTDDDEPTVVTRGWADPRNRPAYGEYDTPLAYRQSLRESRPLDAGERVTVEFPLQATDYRFEQGARLGVVVYASDRLFTLHPPGQTTVTLSLADSSVSVPVVGGGSALADAVPANGEVGPRRTETATASDATVTTADGTASATDGAGTTSEETATMADGTASANDGGGTTSDETASTGNGAGTTSDRTVPTGDGAVTTSDGDGPTTDADGSLLGLPTLLSGGGALATLGGAAYALRRRLTDDE